MIEDLEPIGSFTTTLAVKDANVTDEISRAGASFGDLILTTGKAVAETQRKLNETGANTATELANTLVEVIALQERVFDDQGNVIEGKSYVQHLPLVNFIDPVFYQWSQVRLQGLFYAGEFASASSTSSVSASGSANVGINFLAVSGGYTGKSSTSQVNTDRDSDMSYGNIRMNALLEPRADIGVPKPTQIIQGPRLAIIHGAIADVKPAAVLTGRTMAVMIEYHKRDGSPLADKSISIEAPGMQWSYMVLNAPTETPQQTDADGKLEIQLRREFLDEDADTAPKDFVVSARIGILQNNSTVTF
jgi:hypothetical protein